MGSSSDSINQTSSSIQGGQERSVIVTQIEDDNSQPPSYQVTKLIHKKTCFRSNQRIGKIFIGGYWQNQVSDPPPCDGNVRPCSRSHRWDHTTWECDDNSHRAMIHTSKLFLSIWSMQSCFVPQKWSNQRFFWPKWNFD